jgi:membrane protein implicated in regulation of membrane protease activity
MDWIRDHGWESWLIATIALVCLEMLSMDLMLVMLAGGAASGMLVALLGGPFVAQMLVAVGVALGLLFFVRPPIVHRLHDGPTLVSGAPGLIGQRALVLEPLSHASAGRVRIGGDVWTARPFDEDDEIEVGVTVDVVSIKGATAYVVRIPTQTT